MTDKSKRKVVCFWKEQKLQPDRPHPDQEVILRKTDFNICSSLISINRHIIKLISIKRNIIWRQQRWRKLGSGGQRGGSMVAMATATWRQRQKLGGGSLAAAASGQRQRLPPLPPCCRRTPPLWQQRHRQQQGWRGHRQSTIN